MSACGGSSQGANGATTESSGGEFAFEESILSGALAELSSASVASGLADYLAVAPSSSAGLAATLSSSRCIEGRSLRVDCPRGEAVVTIDSCREDSGITSSSAIGLQYIIDGTIQFVDCSDGVVLLNGPAVYHSVSMIDGEGLHIDLKLNADSLGLHDAAGTGWLVSFLTELSGLWTGSWEILSFRDSAFTFTGDSGQTFCQRAGDSSLSPALSLELECRFLWGEAGVNCLRPPVSCSDDEVCQSFLAACSDQKFARDLDDDGKTLFCKNALCTALPKDLTGDDCGPPIELPLSGGECPYSDNLQGECAVDADCQSIGPGLKCLQGCCGQDSDQDAILDQFDPCPFEAGEAFADCDGDGVGDRCDNCPTIANPGQYFGATVTDRDSDGQGDVCDDDDDNDGTIDTADNCPLIENPNQSDRDGDGMGDLCDVCPDDTDPSDTDLDGVGDACDNCPSVFNPNQIDLDHDGIGSECDVDGDGDGVEDGADNCVFDSNADQADSDGDGDGDACDNCVSVSNSNQIDSDGDLLGDACDPDLDGDGYCNPGDLARSCTGVDNCPFMPNSLQRDSDRDGVGDGCDNCPFEPNADQSSSDTIPDDGVCGSACDSVCVPNAPGIRLPDPNIRPIGPCYCSAQDYDGDLYADGSDHCPFISDPDQLDTDGDGFGDPCDNCPGDFNPGQEDQDGDQIGDACDTPPSTCPDRAPPCDMEEFCDSTVPPEYQSIVYCDLSIHCCAILR